MTSQNKTYVSKQLALITLFILIVTVAGCLSSQALTGEDTSKKCTSSTSYEMGNSSLISASEAVESVDRDNAACSNASLYYVAENGTWYHSNRDGEILNQAPNGSDTVVGNTDIQFNESERPIYIWKLTYKSDYEGESRHGAATYVVDAHNKTVLKRILTP